MYVRLVVGGDAEGHRHLNGLVTEAKILLRAGALSADEAALLEEHYEWLNAHLPVPPYKSSSWHRAVAAWFKDSAREPIRRLWAIGAILEDHGLLVRKLRSQNPGKITMRTTSKLSWPNGNRFSVSGRRGSVWLVTRERIAYSARSTPTLNIGPRKVSDLSQTDSPFPWP